MTPESTVRACPPGVALRYHDPARVAADAERGSRLHVAGEVGFRGGRGENGAAAVQMNKLELAR
jgi:hypothetical protein